MITNLKAIETTYSGYRFRSRLEARWAVFFNFMQWNWQYEKEGFELPSGCYLPDFWIATVNMWAEVKPGPMNKREKKLAQELAIASSFPVLVLDTPEPMNLPYFGYDHDIMGGGYEFCLTNYHNYPQKEHRLFAAPAGHESCWDDTQEAVNAALSARFEHGQSGA